MTSKIKSMFSRITAQCLKPAFAIFAACVVGALASPTSALADTMEIAATLANATATDDVVVTLAGETVSVDSITAASLTVNGFGTINVTGDVNVSGGINFAEKDWNADIATSTGGSYTIKLSAATVSAGTLSGYATVETTGGVTASGTSTFYGTIAGTGGFTANGSNITLYGPNSFTGTLTVNSGTFALNSSLDGITHMFRLDASVDDSIATDDETGYVTSWSSQVNGYTFSNSDNEISVTTDYFGGKKAILTNGKFLTSSFTISSSLFPQSMVSAIRLVSQSGAGAVLYGVDGTKVTNYYLGRRTTASNQNSWKKMVGSSSENTDGFWQNGTYGDRTFRTDAEKTFSVLGFTRNSGMTNFKIGGGAGNVAIAEMIFFDRSNPSIEKVRRIENYLAQKWGIDSGSTSLKEVPVTLANGATFDLGGLTRTVASLSGSGTVQNGALTVTDAINLSAGDVLTLPNTAVFTLGTVAAKIEDTTAGTVTLCGSLADAISAYSTGTLTILQSLTDVNLGTTETSITGIVLADGVSAPTFAANPPFTATYSEGTLTNTRSAATFVYTGPAAYSPVSGNFTIGGVATPAIPGAADTVQFDTAATLDVSATTYTYATVVLNANLTVSGVANTDYGLRSDAISGTGTLVLDDGAVVSTASTSATISAPVEVDASSESPATLFIRENSKNIVLTGALSGSGSLVASCGTNVNYAGVKFRCSDASQFSGEISAPNNNISRNFIAFSPVDMSGAKVVAYCSGSNSGYFIENSASSTIYKFGSLSGRVFVNASGMSSGPCRVEIGALGENDTIDAVWMSSNSERYPNIVKVGTGTLTFTSVSGVNEFILNGGTLVVPSSVTTACSTEMAGYEVVSTPNYDTDGETVLSTTYTLDSGARTWKGVNGNWSDGANWEEGTAPTSAKAVVFPAGEYTIYLDVAAPSCASMTVNGTVEFAQVGRATTVHNELKLYGSVSGEGTVKFVHSGFNNVSGGAITIAPDIEMVDPGVDSDSWFAGGNITVTGDVTVERKLVVWSGNSTAFEGTITLAEGAYMGSWNDNGYLFNGATVVGQGTGATIWTGSAGVNSPVAGTGVTFQGKLTFDTTGGTTISATTATLANGASITVVNGGTVSLAASGEPYEIATAVGSTTTTYTSVNNSTNTWKSDVATGNWKDAANWVNGVAPTSYTDVVFPAGEYTVYISDHNWDPWTERDKAKGMTVNGTVTLQKNGGGWNYLSLYGDISGTGTLKLTWTGLENFTGREMVIGCDLEIVKVAGHDSYLNQINGYGYRLTGDVTVNGLFQVWEGVSFTKTLTFADAGSMVVGADESDTLAIANVVVQSGVAASISGASTATITGTVTLAGEGATLAVPTKMALENSQLKSLVAGKKVAGTTNEGIVTYALADLDTVTVAGVTATYGADFATADVTVAMTGATAGQSYTMTVGGKEYSGTAASNGSVTFSGVETGHDSAYDSFIYTITSDEASVSSGSGSKIIADEAAWFSTSAEGSVESTIGGAWKDDLSWAEGKATVGDGNQFTPTAASSARVVDVTVQVCFGDVNNDSIELSGAKAAVKIATVESDSVFQALNDGVFVTLTGVTPDPAATYTVALRLDYVNQRYSVNIGGTQMTYNESQWLAMPNDATAMTAVAFQGQGTLTSLVGTESEGYVAMDAAGNRYATLGAAMAAGNDDPTKLPLTVLHDGTLNNETYAKSSQVLPVGINNVTINAADQDAANAAVANMDIVLTSDQVTQGLKKDYYKAVATKSGEGTYTLSIELDETEVAPTVAADTKNKAMEVSATTGVSLNVTNTKKGLYYGIAAGNSTELGVANAGTLTLCSSDNQDLDLTANMPESGVKYYKVIVSDEPKSND